MRRRLYAIAWLILLSFVLGEIFARAYLTWFAPDHVFRLYASVRQLNAWNKKTEDPTFRYMPHRYIGYIPTPNYQQDNNRHNALGYRGENFPREKPPGEFRIVCLGGSTTYTSAVSSWKYAYPTLLEKELHARGHENVRVINAGAEGWTTYESLINFELRVLELEPDLIIVYHAVNDNMSRFVWPREAYRGDNSGVRGPTVSSVVMPSILEYSAFLRMGLIRAGWAQPHGLLSRTLSQEQPTDYVQEFGAQVSKGTYPEGLFKELSARELLEANQPVFYRRNLESLIAVARRHHCGTVLASFTYCPEFKEEPFVTHPDYVWTFDEANAILADVASKDGAQFFDFAAQFPRAKQYFADGLHVNHEGAELKAKYFAEYLVSAKLLPDPGR